MNRPALRALPLAALLLLACGGPLPAPSLAHDGLGADTCASAPLVAGPDAGCPATWADARALCADAAKAPCTGFGVRCSYPGAGDQLPDRSWATAVLSCFDTSGTGAGPGEWRCAQ